MHDRLLYDEPVKVLAQSTDGLALNPVGFHATDDPGMSGRGKQSR
jgi:hypothetical protein